MMRVIVRFYESSIRLILDSSKHEKKIILGFIEATLSEDKKGVVYQMFNMKTISLTMPEHEVRKTFDVILEMIDIVLCDMQFMWAIKSLWANMTCHHS